MTSDTSDRLTQLTSRFTELRIAVIGDLLLDEFVWGRVDRISPEAPVPVVEVLRETRSLGGAGNVARNLRSMGARVEIAGVVGQDLAGEAFQQLLAEEEVDSDGVIVDPTRKTTQKRRIIAHHQQVCRTDHEDKRALQAKVSKELLFRAGELIGRCDAVILSDYAKGVLADGRAADLIRRAATEQRFVAVDPKSRDFSCYRGASVITPNQQEAETASGMMISDRPSLCQAAERLFEVVQSQSLLITRGEAGMTLFRRGTAFDIPAVAREVYDVTGAGDTVIALFTLGIAAGSSLHDAAVLANHGAGIVVAKLGTASATLDELLASLRVGDRHETGE